MSVSNIVKTEEKKPYKPGIRSLMRMEYLDILDNYLTYPSDQLKYIIKKANDQKKPVKFKFLSEQDKAYGWKQKFSNDRRGSKFLQCNLHYLPEHLWNNLRPVIHEDITVGYKVNDNNINFFVHKADSDNISKELFEEIKFSRCNRDFSRGELYEKVSDLNSKLIEKGIESWMTIRASKLLEGIDKWEEVI